MSTHPTPDPDEQRIKDHLAHIQLMREAAKQLATLTTILPTLYFAVLSFSDLRKSGVQGYEALPFLLPALPWPASQMLIGQIFLPQQLPPEKPAERVERLKRRTETYYTQLKRAYWALFSGLVLLVCILGYYLVAVPVPPSNP